MAKLSAKDKEKIDKYLELFDQINSSLIKEEKMIIEMIEKLKTFRKELYLNKPSKIMLISYKNWKDKLETIDDNLLKLYKDLEKNLDEHERLYKI